MKRLHVVVEEKSACNNKESFSVRESESKLYLAISSKRKTDITCSSPRRVFWRVSKRSSVCSPVPPSPGGHLVTAILGTSRVSPHCQLFIGGGS